MSIIHKYNIIHKYRIHRCNRPILQRGFTLIEVIVYCTIFIIFAVVAIESMIWFDNKLKIQADLARNRNSNVYRIYFANIYERYKINNQKIKTIFPELIGQTIQIYPSLKEDKDLGIVLDQTSTQKEKVENKVTFFDSIGF